MRIYPFVCEPFMRQIYAIGGNSGGAAKYARRLPTNPHTHARDERRQCSDMACPHDDMDITKRRRAGVCFRRDSKED
jgi:hypothetical protein